MTTIVFFAQKNQGLAPSFCYRGHILFLTHLSNSENRKTKVQYMKQFLCSFNCKNKNKIKQNQKKQDHDQEILDEATEMLFCSMIIITWYPKWGTSIFLWPPSLAGNEQSISTDLLLYALLATTAPPQFPLKSMWPPTPKNYTRALLPLTRRLIRSRP